MADKKPPLRVYILSFCYISYKEVIEMEKWVCQACGFEYDPADGVPPGTSFEDLQDDWVCPVCGAAKSQFKKES